MDIYRELALESAENLPAPPTYTDKKLSRRVTLRRFTSESRFGRAGEERPGGTYNTLLTEGDVLTDPALFGEISEGLSRVLSEYVRRGDRLLVVGLGNPELVVDSLGGACVRRLTPRGGRGYLTTVTPSVYGVTGLESATVVKGVAREIRPDRIIAIDTLATRKAERLSRAVQIGEEGITPGGGVGNPRLRVTEESVGYPVLSIGVPLLAHAELCSDLPVGLVVTPKEIDLLADGFARCIADGIEGVL